MAIMDKVLSNWLQIFMGTFFVMIVVCTVASIQYVGVIPFTVYCVIPSCGVMDIFVVYLIFPFITGCHEETEVIIENAYKKILIRKSSIDEKMFTKKYINSRKNLHEKMIKSTKPISLKCGNIFVLKKSTKGKFYEAVIARVIDGVLL